MMKLKKNIAWSDTGFVFDPSTGDSFTVNPIGLDMIRLLKEGNSREVICEKILEDYEADAVQVERDYDDFINLLYKLKLTEDDGKAQG